MRRLVSALQFMRVVPPLPSLMMHAGAAVTLAGGLALATGAARGRDVITPLLAWQVFAVSTGFATYARRGHYDVLLTDGVGRRRSALAHWIFASLPGVTGWLALAACEAVVMRQAPELLTAGAAAAMLVVSTLPWALTIGLPRFSAAIGWVLVAATTSSLLPHAVEPGGPPRDGGGWSMVFGYLLFPMWMVDPGAGVGMRHVLSAVTVAAASMAAALLWVARRDIPLESGQ